MGVLQTAICKDEQIRRALIIGRSDINGVDYLNVDPTDHNKLTVFFLNAVGPKNAGDPNSWSYVADPTLQARNDGSTIVNNLRLTYQINQKSKLNLFADYQKGCTGAAWNSPTLAADCSPSCAGLAPPDFRARARGTSTDRCRCTAAAPATTSS